MPLFHLFMANETRLLEHRLSARQHHEVRDPLTRKRAANSGCASVSTLRTIAFPAISGPCARLLARQRGRPAPSRPEIHQHGNRSVVMTSSKRAGSAANGSAMGSACLCTRRIDRYWPDRAGDTILLVAMRTGSDDWHDEPLFGEYLHYWMHRRHAFLQEVERGGGFKRKRGPPSRSCSYQAEIRQHILSRELIGQRSASQWESIGEHFLLPWWRSRRDVSSGLSFRRRRRTCGARR